MKKIEVQMLLYTLTKKFIEIFLNILNPFSIILFYKVMWWFDGQDVGVEPKKPRFNPPCQHILYGICTFVYIPYTIV
jgi:hypothetical protein